MRAWIMEILHAIRGCPRPSGGFFFYALCALACFLACGHALAFPSLADTVNLDVSYGYQNTAKAGRFLPLKISIENTMEETFSGYIHVYMAESEDILYEYRYQSTVEAASSAELSVTISLGTGVSQILVTAENREGVLLGTKRIGLDVAGSDAELIIGILSDNEAALSYWNGISIHDGLLRTRTVNLDPAAFPSDETELDQLDLLLVSDFSLSRIKESEAAALNRWIGEGGILLIGTGKKGKEALSPYYRALLRSDLDPMEMSVDMGTEFGNGEPGSSSIPLTASAVYLRSGREVLFSDVVPILSAVSRGTGLIAIAGYDFCDIQRFATEHSGYLDGLLSELLGQNRLQSLSVSASEKSLNQYWDIQELMNLSNVSKLPLTGVYTAVFALYVLLAGPGLYFYMQRRDALRLYRPSILILSALSVLLLWAAGINTRFNGAFLTYAKLRDISERSIDETDYINIRSPYSAEYGLRILPEYFVYPVLRGSDYTGNITERIGEGGIRRTSIDYERSHSMIRIQNEPPFSAKYFELDNRIPNSGGAFTGEVSYFQGQLGGSIHNGTDYTLYDAALLFYGELLKIGRLEAGESVSLAECEHLSVPVGNNAWIASKVSTGPGQNFLRYYLSQQLLGYFEDARLIGFVREDGLNFTEDKIESYGVSMAVASLPLRRSADGLYEYNALRREPEVVSGDYDPATNTVGGSLPTTLAYHLGEDEEIRLLGFSLLYAEEAEAGLPYAVTPFRGTLSFFNRKTGVFDVVDLRGGSLSKAQLAPYLDEENVLELRFITRDESGASFSRQYLPMITVTAEE